jgi:hypothetical protein
MVASFWAWVRGLDGDMAMAGAVTASAKAAAEVIVAAAVPWPIAVVMHMAAEEQCAAVEVRLTAMQRHLMVEGHTPVQVTQRYRRRALLMLHRPRTPVRLTPQLRIVVEVVHHTVVAAAVMAAVEDMAAVNTSSQRS